MTRPHRRAPHRRSPTVTEEAFREILRATGLIKRLGEPHFSSYGIRPGQWGVLRSLHRRELQGLGPPRLTDLGSLLLIRPPSVTGVVDRLERSRLVAKIPSSEDQRIKHVTLTDAGRRLVERALVSHPEWIVSLMSGLERREHASLLQLLRKVTAHLAILVEHGSEAHATRARASGDGDGADSGASSQLSKPRSR
jgi:DNA-binding MarR family transcriptional regulator